MAIIALCNLKGGVGKSTLAINLAGALSGQGKVSLLDADPQATATAWAEAGGLPFQVIEAPLEAGNVSEWIEAALSLDAPTVIVDLPPMLGDASAAALAIADLACIPVAPSGADLRATNRAVELVHDARRARGDDKPKALLIPSKVDRRTAAGAEIEAVLHDYGEPVAPAIGQRIDHVNAFSAGQWIGDDAKASAGHTEIKTLASVVRRTAGKTDRGA